MATVTYGAPGYMEWGAQIKAGKATVNISFTGGSLTVYGITPARYTTSDRFIQTVIENSQHYRDGRIIKLSTEDTEENALQEQPKEKSQSKEEQKEVKVECLQDAQAYLQDNFGIASRNVRSQAQALRVGEEKGIKFIFE